MPAVFDTSALVVIRNGLDRAERLILAEDYAGYDPYDALCSPVFRLPVVRRSRVARRGAQQVLRRLPVNLRPVLGIRKGRNPVTLGLGLHAWALLAKARPDSAEHYTRLATSLVPRIEAARSPGWSGSCWGYDFDWEARGQSLPAGTPTVVATAFVTNGLFAAHELLGESRALELCADATGFVRHDLHRTPGPDGSFCWSYSPLDRGRVLNATAKGSRLLAQVAAATGRDDLLEDAERSLAYVVAHQREDGSWPYAVDDPRSWADNFHTAYVLDALAEYGHRSGDERFSDAVERGWRYYRRSFFEDGWLPRYYDTSLYPIDATAVAQSLITLCRFGDVEAAVRAAAWAVARLQRRNGGFAYRVYRHWSNRIHYMRWSTAWMLLGLATVEATAAGAGPPQRRQVERHVEGGHVRIRRKAL